MVDLNTDNQLAEKQLFLRTVLLLLLATGWSGFKIMKVAGITLSSFDLFSEFD